MAYKTQQELFWESLRKKGTYFFMCLCVLILWAMVVSGIYAIWADVDISKLLFTLSIVFLVSLLHIAFLDVYGT